MKFYSTIIIIVLFCVIDTESTSKYNDEPFWNEKRKLNSSLCNTMNIPPQNPEICEITKQQQKHKIASRYQGVYWHRESGKWYVLLNVKGKQQKYGGKFNDELEAARRVNQLCEELEIPPQNSAISAIPMPNRFQKNKKTSQFKGVYWYKQIGKWRAQLSLKGKQTKSGGYFNNEHDAGKMVNQLCEECGIAPQNPKIIPISNQQDEVQKKQNSSKYKGVYWNRKIGKWYAQLSIKGEKRKFVGEFNDELEAAKRINEHCEKWRIPLQNPGIAAMTTLQLPKREKISQFNGVYWYKQIGKWRAHLCLKAGKTKSGGYFNNEKDAGKMVNQLCKECGIPPQNPEINEVSNQKYEKNLVNYDTVRTEFESLLKLTLFHEKNDSVTTTIKENLIAAINYGEQARWKEINLRTKKGESALSIAAKYGLSNVVKFLISKGAKKQHFTNEHHTPLSLAVTHNHLKVVQVLFEQWISPNFYEKQFLHVSPIFNVKSREIAQLLIDNDAITSEVYNNKNQSPLTVACQNGYLDVVEFFLDDGLDIDHLDCENKTPLFYALTNKHPDVANLLISRGAKSMHLKSYYTK